MGVRPSEEGFEEQSKADGYRTKASSTARVSGLETVSDLCCRCLAGRNCRDEGIGTKSVRSQGSADQRTTRIGSRGLGEGPQVNLTNHRAGSASRGIPGCTINRAHRSEDGRVGK